MSSEIENSVSQETISLVTMLMAAQVVKNALEDLRKTSYYRKKLKIAIDQCLIALHNECNKDINSLWKTDEILSMNLMQGIQDIGKSIAKSKDPSIIYNIRQLLRDDIDFEKIKIIELKHKPKIKNHE